MNIFEVFIFITKLLFKMQRLIPLFVLFIFSCNANKQKNTEKNELSEKAKDTIVKNKIYLTFDDGPTLGSKALYDYVNEKKLPVGLFLVGDTYKKMPLLQKKLDTMAGYDYIVTANHSYSHAFNNNYNKFYNNTVAVVDDYQKASAVLPLNTNIARTAGRNLWRLPTINVTDEKGPPNGPDSLNKMGLQFLGWDCTWPYDYKTLLNTRDVAGMMNRIHIYFDSSFTKVPHHLVMLLHDQQLSKPENFKQFKDFVDAIEHSTTYQFANLRDYPALNKIELVKK
jgi:peptidoglycan-N-acetylglucosamine deacetylase